MAAVLAGAGAAAAQMPWQKPAARGGEAKPMVVFLYPEQVTVAAGKPQTVELHFRVADGLHINSHTPRVKSLIRTELIVAEVPGLSVEAVDFPPGTDFALAMAPNDKLSVYTGEFVLKAHVKAAAGDHLLEGALRYQACDANECYPPRKASVAVDVIAK